MRPHVPLIAPERNFEPYPLVEIELPPVVVGDNVPDEALRRQNDRIFGMDEIQKRKVIRSYMASVRFMDEQFGCLLDALDDLGGLSGEVPGILQGNSLLDNIRNSDVKNQDSYAYSITNGGRAGTLRAERWRYTRWGENVEQLNEELYDHENDPEEHVNLADDPNNLSVLEEMRKKYEMVRNKARSGLEAD